MASICKVWNNCKLHTWNIRRMTIVDTFKIICTGPYKLQQCSANALAALPVTRNAAVVRKRTTGLPSHFWASDISISTSSPAHPRKVNYPSCLESPVDTACKLKQRPSQDIWSLHGFAGIPSCVRTNNLAEGYHNSLNTRLEMAHPSLRSFMHWLRQAQFEIHSLVQASVDSRSTAQEESCNVP